MTANVKVNLVRANGTTETLPNERPVRAHAGVEYVQVKGYARPFTRNADGSVTVDMRVPAIAPKSDAAKAAFTRATTAAAAVAPVTRKAGVPKARTQAQLDATVRMCAGNLARAMAGGDADTIAKAQRALATATANAAPTAKAPTDETTAQQIAAIQAMAAHNPALAALLGGKFVRR